MASSGSLTVPQPFPQPGRKGGFRPGDRFREVGGEGLPDRFVRKERHRLVKEDAVDPGIVPRLRFFPIDGG